MANPLQMPFIFATATSPVSSVNLDTDYNYLAGVYLDTIAALRLTTPKTSGPPRVILFGSSAVGTGQTGFFWFNPADTTSPDNGTTIIVAADGGRWYYTMSIPAANITGSHTLPDGVLSTNVPLLNAANTFTANQTIAKSSAEIIVNDTSAANIAVALFQSNGTTKAAYGVANTTNAFITGSVAGDVGLWSASGRFLFSGDGGASAFLALSNTGLVTTKIADPAEVGYQGIPQSIQVANYVTVKTDANKAIMLTKNGAQTATIDDSVGYPIGTTLMFVNANAGAAADQVLITTGQAYLAGTGFGTSGTRNLAYGGVATYYKYAALSWLCWGTGLS